MSVDQGHRAIWLDAQERRADGTSAGAPLVAGVYALAGNAATIQPGFELALPPLARRPRRLQSAVQKRMRAQPPPES
jgi:hypothetical protein